MKLIILLLICLFLSSCQEYVIINADDVFQTTIEACNTYKKVILTIKTLPDSSKEHYIDSFLLKDRESALKIKGSLETKSYLRKANRAIDEYLSH